MAPARPANQLRANRSQPGAPDSQARERSGRSGSARAVCSGVKETAAQQARAAGRRNRIGRSRRACARSATRCCAGSAPRPSSRPPPDSTRQASRSMSPGCSEDSSAWTISTRSIEKSWNGNSVSSAKVTRLRSPTGQWITPWPAGISASTRSASLANGCRIRRRKAEAQQRLAAQIRPERANPRLQQPAGHPAQRRLVEIVEIDDVLPHDGTRPRLNVPG